jgi:hypothetical protein
MSYHLNMKMPGSEPSAFDAWRHHPGDIALYVGAWLTVPLVVGRDRRVKDRLADVEVPHGVLMAILMSTLIRQRRWTG